MSELIARWRSVKRKENRFRHYSLSLSRDLWGREVLIKRWGRIGHQKVESYYRPKSYLDLLEEIRKTASTRREHGYQLIPADSLLYMLKYDIKNHIDNYLHK